MLSFRQEAKGDQAGVRRVNEQAFETGSEADLVDTLREHGAFVLSMVAEQKGDIVGHVLVTTVKISNEADAFDAIGIGPMAVLPEHQRKGIGTSLLKTALIKCRELGHEIVIVLGHPEFYPRFGFVPSAPLGIRCEFDAPEEAFMILELREHALRGRTGIASYRPEFKML